MRKYIWVVLSFLLVSVACHTPKYDLKSPVVGARATEIYPEKYIKALVENTAKISILCLSSNMSITATGVYVGKIYDRFYLVTAHHVVSDMVNNPTCLGTASLPGRIPGVFKIEEVSPEDDLAVISFSCLSCKSGTPIQVAERHFLGQGVISVGHQGIRPSEVRGFYTSVSISQGMLATEIWQKLDNKKVLKLLRVTSQVAGGNSGGGIFNKDGFLVGIVSFGMVFLPGTGSVPYEGQYFVVPHNKIEDLLEKVGLGL